jgi:hypothetical protein
VGCGSASKQGVLWRDRLPTTTPEFNWLEINCNSLSKGIKTTVTTIRLSAKQALTMKVTCLSVSLSNAETITTPPAAEMHHSIKMIIESEQEVLNFGITRARAAIKSTDED